MNGISVLWCPYLLIYLYVDIETSFILLSGILVDGKGEHLEEYLLRAYCQEFSQDRQCTYNATLRRLRETIVIVLKQ